VDVQVHLENRQCIAELRQTIRNTLQRAARTWAPLPLPVDRIVVAAGFPPEGKADIYDEFFRLAGQDKRSGVTGESMRLVVISLGLRNGERDLSTAEIAGALATQVQRVVDERYRQHTAAEEPAAAPAPVSAKATARPSTARSSRLSRTGTASSSTTAVGPDDPTTRDGADAATDQAVPTLQELLATVQEGQPLVAAGPTPNGTNS
jgi:hypothetical protein